MTEEVAYELNTEERGNWTWASEMVDRLAVMYSKDREKPGGEEPMLISQEFEDEILGFMHTELCHLLHAALHRIHKLTGELDSAYSTIRALVLEDDELDSMQETVDILGDPETMAVLTRGQAAIAAGDTIDISELPQPTDAPELPSDPDLGANLAASCVILSRVDVERLGRLGGGERQRALEILGRIRSMAHERAEALR